MIMITETNNEKKINVEITSADPSYCYGIINHMVKKMRSQFIEPFEKDIEKIIKQSNTKCKMFTKFNTFSVSYTYTQHNL